MSHRRCFALPERSGEMAGRTAGRRAMLGALTLTIAMAATPAAAEREEFRYRVSWGEFPVLEATVVIDRGEGRYLIAGSGATIGPAAWLFPWEGEASSEGSAIGDRLAPQRHESTGIVRDELRRTSLTWTDANAPPLASVDPPADPEKVTPVPADSTVGTVDPFTALLRTLDSVARTGRCEGREQVWDGRRRYDLAIEHLGVRDLPAEESDVFTGPAVGCRLVYHRIGGFYRDSPWGSEGQADRIVWVAELPEGRWVPVRVELTTRLGRVIGRLQRS